MKYIVAAAVSAAALCASAQAALVEISFTGEVTAASAARAADPSQNAYGADVREITGRFIYDTETAGAPFGTIGFNYDGAITGFFFETGVEGVGNGLFSGGFERQPGFGTASVRNLPGGDNVTFGNFRYGPSLLEGESDNVVSLAPTLSFRGGPDVLSTNDLMAMYDASAFDFVQLSLFIDEDENTDLTVSFTYNLTDVTFSELNEVPVPGAVALFATGLIGAATARRARRR